jgi:hypothetical protein
LEIDEGLQVGSDELVNHKDDQEADNNHQWQGHIGKPDAITTLKILW